MHIREAEVAPDTILPAQLYEGSLAGARLQAEKRLQVAVLADAVLTYHRLAGQQRPRARRLFGEIEAWFASGEADGPFSFVAICESLGLDPGYLRRGLWQWRSRLEARAEQKGSFRRDGNGSRHQVVLPRLRRVA